MNANTKIHLLLNATKKRHIPALYAKFDQAYGDAMDSVQGADSPEGELASALYDIVSKLEELDGLVDAAMKVQG